jgi:hypothetical protein
MPQSYGAVVRTTHEELFVDHCDSIHRTFVSHRSRIHIRHALLVNGTTAENELCFLSNFSSVSITSSKEIHWSRACLSTKTLCVSKLLLKTGMVIMGV